MSILLVLVFALLVLVFFGSFFEAPWVPTKKRDFDRIANLAKLRDGMLFCDLGSGTGKMLFYLSGKYKVNCVGIEVSPILYLYSKVKSLFYKNVKIVYGNFYKYDLSKADIVYAFLLPKAFNKVKEKIKKELKEDSKIITSSWPLENYSPVEVSKIDGGMTYYLYNKKSILI